MSNAGLPVAGKAVICLERGHFCPSCSNAKEELSWSECCRCCVQQFPPKQHVGADTSEGWLQPAEGPRSREEDVTLLKRGDP